ncbi:hypothetical protein TSTA_084340 [Talaromyces stipitatus ATCC 10500]|uniref:Uncharacterized protein n=1 Tax=Talaromyces stipitatus (strain ATCC 10500 / CBS 375.48 / QM 6759 / NRRL 1006) TaxID=441959 RepID=B8M0A6_TALSN|nr:uncharacterized protein TSTA_084340 [Talaromyces stipitatus ATCC 10500]EED21203.1 hypothetical protein TSTA_084340 [Talaromyces stipitatus ATCC 10500]
MFWRSKPYILQLFKPTLEEWDAEDNLRKCDEVKWREQNLSAIPGDLKEKFVTIIPLGGGWYVLCPKTKSEAMDIEKNYHAKRFPVQKGIGNRLSLTGSDFCSMEHDKRVKDCQAACNAYAEVFEEKWKIREPYWENRQKAFHTAFGVWRSRMRVVLKWKSHESWVHCIIECMNAYEVDWLIYGRQLK